MRIPLDPEGYSVNRNTGTIHTRYADHGNGQRTRTAKGALHLVGDNEPRPCSLCYPNPRYAPEEKPKVPQKRRVQSNGA